MKPPRILRNIEFASAIFAGAFLLFQVQPLLGKYILPWFGGTPAVWTVCLLFFQSLLFFGYAYAHASVRFLGWKAQLAVHLTLLVVASLLLPITPDTSWNANPSLSPAFQILGLLLTCVGLPYFLLAATSPLLQAWFSRAHPGAVPYGFYALSNLGSLVALLSYPVLVEPALDVERQAQVWSWLFRIFAVLCGWCAWRVFRQVPSGELAAATGTHELAAAAAELRCAVSEGEPEAERSPDQRRRSASPGWSSCDSEVWSAHKPTWSTVSMWFLLALVPSTLLLAVTDQICTDVAVVPFLWVLPLTLYLISFILCFHSPRWRPRVPWALGWLAMLSVGIHVMHASLGVQSSLPILGQLAAYSGLMFVGAMVCHGELARMLPAPAHLTAFYLTLAAGGGAGGLFVGLLAPLIFPQRVELSLATLGCSVLLLVVFFRDRSSRLHHGRIWWGWAGLLTGLALQTVALVLLFKMSLTGVQVLRRNFYGVLQVKMRDLPGPNQEQVCILMNGVTMHGSQFVNTAKFLQPTTYYGPESGVGLVLRHHGPASERRIGVVGLGVGTVAAYGRPTDTFRFYEINPDVIDLAQEWFQYLANSPARVEIVAGDARVRLEHEPPQRFDILVLDAFSSDAIPVHLLTLEAFQVYQKHLKRDGILAVHVSNVHLDLRPVVAASATRCGLKMVSVYSERQPPLGIGNALWCLLSLEQTSLDLESVRQAEFPPVEREVLWTDRRNSLFEVLR